MMLRGRHVGAPARASDWGACIIEGRTRAISDTPGSMPAPRRADAATHRVVEQRLARLIIGLRADRSRVTRNGAPAPPREPRRRERGVPRVHEKVVHRMPSLSALCACVRAPCFARWRYWSGGTGRCKQDNSTGERCGAEFQEVELLDD